MAMLGQIPQELPNMLVAVVVALVLLAVRVLILSVEMEVLVKHPQSQAHR
jgi:hypothetical protein